MRLREEHLVQLGFERQDVSEEESGDVAYHYYTMDLSETNRNFCLLSCANNEVENGEWNVEFLETEIKFFHYEHLRDLIYQFENLKKFNENEKKYSPNKI